MCNRTFLGRVYIDFFLSKTFLIGSSNVYYYDDDDDDDGRGGGGGGAND